MTMPLPLRLQAVSKDYGKKRVLSDVSLALEPGEIFGLLGLNGAGKTTLIKIVLDLVRASGGTAALFGVESTQPEARRQLSYLPEKFQPSRYLKGMEYLQITLESYGQALDVERARAVVTALDLDPVALEMRVGHYSKGMGQKLGLAGALLANTALIVLDEPMSGLDPRARIRLKEALLAARAEGRTVFFSSHILADVEEICHRVGVIHQGALSFVGTPAALQASCQRAGSTLEAAFLEWIERSAA